MAGMGLDSKSGMRSRGDFDSATKSLSLVCAQCGAQEIYGNLDVFRLIQQAEK